MTYFFILYALLLVAFTIMQRRSIQRANRGHRPPTISSPEAQRLIRLQRWTVRFICVPMSARAVIYWPPFMCHATPGELTMFFGAMIGFLVVYIYIRLAWHRGIIQTSGPYRIVAHPIYCMYFFGDSPLWCVFASTPLFVGTAAIFYATLLASAYVEERLLMTLYPEVVAPYYRRTLSWHFFLTRLAKPS